MRSNSYKTILHLSYDIGGEGKTTAVQKLIDVTQEFSKAKVISLDRVVKRGTEILASDVDGYLSIKSFGLPYGFFLLNNLKRVYDSIRKADPQKILNLKSIDIIHAHKLTYEGYIGYLLAKKLDLPLFITLRQTDTYVLKYRPDLMGLMKNILKFCNSIFYVMPYMVIRLEKLFGKEFFNKELQHKLVFLPNIIDRKINGQKIGSPKKYLFAALRMTRKSVKRKNVKNLFKALETISDMGYELHIAGDGPYFKVLRRWSDRYNISHTSTLLGSIPNSEMDRYYAEATAFVMPSFSETFGMVYAEALMNGTPILYSKYTGFDGLFENVGVAVNPHSTFSIGKGLRELIDNNAFYRETICNLRETNAFHIFSPAYAKDTYSKVLNKIS